MTMPIAIVPYRSCYQPIPHVPSSDTTYRTRNPTGKMNIYFREWHHIKRHTMNFNHSVIYSNIGIPSGPILLQSDSKDYGDSQFTMINSIVKFGHIVLEDDHLHGINDGKLCVDTPINFGPGLNWSNTTYCCISTLGACLSGWVST